MRPEAMLENPIVPSADVDDAFDKASAIPEKLRRYEPELRRLLMVPMEDRPEPTEWR